MGPFKTLLIEDLILFRDRVKVGEAPLPRSRGLLSLTPVLLCICSL